MPERCEPVDLLAFVGERGRQYVLPTSEPETTDPTEPAAVASLEPTRRSRRERKAESRAAARAAVRAQHLARAGIAVEPVAPVDDTDHALLAGDPEHRYVAPLAAAGSGGRQRAWLVCVLVLALGLPALVVSYGYNRGAEPAAAMVAAPPTTASTIRPTTSEKRVTTEATAEETSTVAELEETTTSTEAPTTSTTAYVTSSTTAYTTTSTTAVATTAVQAQAAAIVAPAPTTTAYVPPTTAYVPPTTSAPATGEAAFLACVRMRESGGNYGAVSPGGTYRGAYQFYQGTWDSTASMAGRPDLIGMLPNLAAPADQDLLAATLYRAYGAGPWGGYCG